MFYRTVFLVVVFVFVGLTVADKKSSEFVAIKSRDGQVELCAVDVPTAVDWYSAHGSDVHCGLQCQRRIDCKAFNFNSLLGNCEQYKETPTNFSVIPGCKGYAIDSTCPGGWVKAGSSCYKLIPRMFVGWQESRDYCSAIKIQQKQARLVVIDSEEKQRLIHKLLFTAYGGMFGYSNLALRKSAFQSSTRDGGCCAAGNAVDGNITSRPWQSCTHTLIRPPPHWWAVDLGYPIFVYGVNLTNRFNGSAVRMNNFIVALTNNLSSSSFPRNYTLCGKGPGVAPDGATMFVGCAIDLELSRYAAIIVTESDALTICQVQVYGITGLIWLAGRRQSFNEPSSSFVWSPFSSSSTPMSYSNWNITGPSAVGDWNCVAMDATTGIWINAPCNSTNVYTLCELMP